MQIKYKLIIGLSALGLLLNGCATKEPQPKQKSYLKNINYIIQKERKQRIKEEINTESYHFMVKPIVGSEQDDSKVIVNMGKILKIWIAPYVVGGTLIAAHSIYSWVVPPKFIPGESVGRVSPTDSSLLTPSGNYPLIYRPAEVYNKKPTFSNKEIKEYVNKTYQVDKHPDKYLKNIDNRDKDKYDKLIKQFLNNHKD